MNDKKTYMVVDEDGNLFGSYTFYGNPQIGDVFDVNDNPYFVIAFIRRWIKGFPTLTAGKVEK